MQMISLAPGWPSPWEEGGESWLRALTSSSTWSVKLNRRGGGGGGESGMPALQRIT